MESDELRIKVYEWGKSLQTEEAMALARRFLDIHRSAVACARLIEALPNAQAPADQATIVTRLEVELVNELADQVAKAAPLFERVSAQLHGRSRSGPAD